MSALEHGCPACGGAVDLHRLRCGGCGLRLARPVTYLLRRRALRADADAFLAAIDDDDESDLTAAERAAAVGLLDRALRLEQLRREIAAAA